MSCSSPSPQNGKLHDMVKMLKIITDLGYDKEIYFTQQVSVGCKEVATLSTLMYIHTVVPAVPAVPATYASRRVLCGLQQAATDCVQVALCQAPPTVLLCPQNTLAMLLTFRVS